ncbi:hypothetical protein NZK35_14630 [Stieleria sp. ICT_E10.1]|uniref:hypothetical protein n=1 Tax=Stieleria sedimenti TaxID=2976331 RepID=UPI0021804F40|nr:hypothetical protein [Stieleria sedimenti]MCS7467886.1 hypothetical protein [Stieleria sedimenti]
MRTDRIDIKPLNEQTATVATHMMDWNDRSCGRELAATPHNSAHNAVTQNRIPIRVVTKSLPEEFEFGVDAVVSDAEKTPSPETTAAVD